MVFSKFGEAMSAVSSHLLGTWSSTSPYMPPALSSEEGKGLADDDLGLTNVENKNSMRLSSSLQDFSLYNRLEPEDANLSVGMDRSINHVNPFLQRENVSSSFSKEKASLSGVPNLRRKWLRIFLIFLFIFLFLSLVYMVFIYVYSNLSQGVSKFFVVLDCGSTGTRVYVYKASIDNKNDGSLPISMQSLTEGVSRKPSSQSGRAYDRMETEPGFHKLVHNRSGLKFAINPLVSWAEKQIPQDAHKTTSLFLYATAGVRRLPSADSKWLLDNAWSILKNSPFLCRREWVKVITGTEEAYYGWAALNYRTATLGTSPRRETFGALDLGGSSLQVTFENERHPRNETNLSLRIGAANHHLSAYSLSGYGLNDAFDKSVVQLLKRLPNYSSEDLVNEKLEIKHPCLHSGYKEKYICSQCAARDQGSESSVVGEKHLNKGGKIRISVHLVGAPDWADCSALAKGAVNLSVWANLESGIDCELQPCAIPATLPRPYGQFYAISGFFVVYRFFNLSSEAALDDILEKGRQFCEKAWDIAKNSVAPQPFIEQYCFRAPYIVSLLREGLHITDTQVIVGSGSFTWTLGVALLEAGASFSNRLGLHSYEIMWLKIEPIAVIAILVISLIFLVCALSFVGNWMPRFFRRAYLPLFRHNNANNSSVLNLPSPFRFQRWSPINSGDGRVKMPLSPTVNGSQQRPFGMGYGLGGSSIQLVESSLYPSNSSVSHSYSASSLGQMQFESSFWSPHRSQMRLQSRRSQSREDLNSSLAETKV